MVDLLLMAIVLAVGIVMLAINRNFLSPGKMIFASTVVFYLGVFLGDVSTLTTFSYLFLMLALVVVAFVDVRVPCGGGRGHHISIEKYAILLLLLMPAFFLKIDMIVDAGGLVPYLMSLAFRVVELEGRGWIVVVFSSVQVVYVYSVYIFMLDERRGLAKSLCFLLSTLVFLFVGLSSGSRSSLMMPLVTVLVMRHYLFRRVRMLVLGGCAFLFLAFVALYGSFRNDFGGSEFSEFDLSGLDFSHFYYGTNPLEILARSDVNDPLLGATYASLVTNFIPRSIFPGKPDTGGLFFTKMYTGDQWEGMSNLAPGSFVEGAMNFGLVPGMFFGGLLTLMVMVSSVYVFRKSIFYYYDGASNIYLKGAFFIAAFNYVLVAARFSYSEFANVFFSFALFVFFPLAVSFFFLRFKVRFKGRIDD